LIFSGDGGFSINEAFVARLVLPEDKGRMRSILSRAGISILSLSYFFTAILLSCDVSFAQPNGSSKRPVQSIVLCDYNGGSLSTNLNGLSGGDEEKPGVNVAAVTKDDGVTFGNSGYSARLDYDVSGLGEYTFYWIKLHKEIPGKPGVTGTLSLRNYNYLSFWVKNDRDGGNIKVELHQDINADGIFTFGKDITSFVYVNDYLKNKIMLKEWQKVVIPLKDLNMITDWSKMIELVFVLENRAGNKKGIINIDDVIFGYRPEDTLSSKNAGDIAAPAESTFRVNGTDAKQCLAFKGSNELRIAAEDIRRNPYIESVGFEYSTDRGATWRTIGRDYDVSKDIYKVSWEPDNSRDLYSYQVRAVATDIRGNQKPTGALIDCSVKPMTDDEFLDLVERRAFDFFNSHQNPKNGLFADTSGGGDASIASTGFGIAALCLGAERGWIKKDEAKARVIRALGTFLPKNAQEEPLADGKHGFFYHFLNMNTGKRAGKSEISTVDTAILVCGALMAGEYFGGDVRTRAEQIYKNVEWTKFLSQEKGPWSNMFSMGWSPERGFLESYWDYYTDEVILISLLAIGSPTHPVSPDAFYAWTRQKDSYGAGKPFIYSWHGSLFAYQYANVWFDFRGLVDRQGVDWFENSTNATIANRQFCIDNADKYKGFGENAWGVTSMARPEGYTMHFGTPPTGSGEALYDGTISPVGPAGSIVFTPYLSMSALKYMYLTYPKLWGQYGFRDSYDLDHDWYASTYYGIGVAMLLLPVENFRTGFIWKNFMKNKYVKESLAKAGFAKSKNRR